MCDQAVETPLIELLEKVPEDAVASYEHHATSHSHIPYGHLCHRAVARIKELEGHLHKALLREAGHD